MKSIALSSFLILFISPSWAQNEQLNYKYAFKLYNLSTLEITTNTQWLNNSKTERYENSNTSLSILNPTLAFQWKTRNSNFHEIELTNIQLDQTNRETNYIIDSLNSSQTLFGTKITTNSLMLRYEYTFVFNKKSNSRFVPSLGFGGAPSYIISKATPITSNTFSTTISNIGLRGFVTPRITYYFSSKFFLDLNIPICLFDAQYGINRVENPAFTQSQQTSSQFDFSSFPNYLSARIGIGFKI